MTRLAPSGKEVIIWSVYVSESVDAPTLDEEVIDMREGIHPETNKVTVHCACGETFETISTSKSLRVDICSKCHPFYTGKQKLIDAGGRVDKFRKRMDNQK